MDKKSEKQTLLYQQVGKKTCALKWENITHPNSDNNASRPSLRAARAFNWCCPREECIGDKRHWITNEDVAACHALHISYTCCPQDDGVTPAHLLLPPQPTHTYFSQNEHRAEGKCGKKYCHLNRRPILYKCSKNLEQHHGGIYFPFMNQYKYKTIKKLRVIFRKQIVDGRSYMHLF